MSQVNYSNDVGHLSWDVVEYRITRGALAILPIGAGAKEHGWHLPMRTDQIQAEWLSARLAERIDALIWPTLSYGHHPAFVDYAGSCSLPAGLFEAIVRELAGALVAYGAPVVIIDTGIGTIPPIEAAIAGLADPNRVLHLKIHEGPRYRETAARLETQTRGGHADELETSRMLALAPDEVAMDRTTISPLVRPGPGPLQRANAAGVNYSASGSVGEPRAATREKGEAMLAAMVEDMVAATEAWCKTTRLSKGSRGSGGTLW